MSPNLKTILQFLAGVVLGIFLLSLVGHWHRPTSWRAVGWWPFFNLFVMAVGLYYLWRYSRRKTK